MARHLTNMETLARLRAALLGWYERNRRDLPWRRTRDPYAIWVSEVMLQQTRVAAVVEKYEAFLARFPTVSALAMAPEQEVLAQWSGLGYYRRARMLHKAAQVVAATTRGQMPTTAEELRALPGIGGYTAAAIASIAHKEPVAVVDGNVERVLCRIAGWDANGAHRRKVEELAARLVDELRPGDFNQAMMELGAIICTPRNPQCLVCPVSEDCKTRGEHKTVARPRMVSREVGCALCVRQAASGSDVEIFLEQRPSTVSVMPGLWELPSLREVPDEDVRITVRHAIMNVNYVVRVCDVREEDLAKVTVRGGEGQWIPLRVVVGMALTGLARKVLKRIIAGSVS
jgi:A/G-specific adenine glycosylase